MSALRRGALLGAGAALAALAYDPGAAAADAKRPAVLLAAAVALSAALAGVGRARGSPSGETSIQLAPALWIAFVAWSALSLAWGVSSGACVLAGWAGATGLMLAATSFGPIAARRTACVAGLGIGGGSSLIAIAQYAAGGRGFAVHGGHGNPNWLGLVLAVALPLSIDLTVSMRGERGRGWLVPAALTALQAPALYLSHSRVAWAAAGLALLGWALSRGLAIKGRRARAGALAGVLLAVAPAGAAAFAAWREPPANVANPSADDTPGAADVPVGAAWEGRTWIWGASADAARRAMPLGAGLGGFAHAYLDAQGARLAPLEPQVASRRFANATTAHCDWIEIAAFGGAPGLALFAAAIGAGLVAALRSRWPAGVTTLGAFALAALGDSPLHQPAIALLVALVIAGAPAPHAAPERRALSLSRRRLRRLAPALALAATALLLALATRSWLAVRRLTAARDTEPAAGVALLERAARLDPWSGDAALALGLARLELGDASGALRQLERSRPLLANAGTDVAIGNAHVALGAPERAAEAYTRALGHNPGSFRAHANLTEALVQLGRLDDAAAHLAVARSLWPGHPKLPAIAERLRQARLDAGVGPSLRDAE